MKCSQKDGFVYILLLIIIKPIEGDSVPLPLEGVEVAGKEMSLQELLDANWIQDLSADAENPEAEPHRIVKKQMADYPSTSKNKRSVVAMDPEVLINVLMNENKENQKSLNRLTEAGYSTDKQYKTVKLEDPAWRSRLENGDYTGDNGVRLKPEGEGNDMVVKRKQSKEKNDNKDKNENYDKPMVNMHTNRNASLRDEILKNLVGRPCKRYIRYADKGDYHSYFECEVEGDGNMKFQHKRCPEGEIFSPKYLECLRLTYLRAIRRHKRFPLSFSRKMDPPEPSAGPEDIEPANEWIDAPQSGVNKIPSEFKPRRKPKLKIYHLKWQNNVRMPLPTREDRFERSALAGFGAYEVRRRMPVAAKGGGKLQSFRHHNPRSFLVRVNKKEGKDNQEHEFIDKEEAVEDEDYDEEDYEDYDEEDEEEREDSDEDKSDWTRKRQNDGDWNRRRQSEPEENRGRIGPLTSPKRLQNKSEYEMFPYNTQTGSPVDKHPSNSKKVLIDANIKVDGEIGSVLRNMLSRDEKTDSFKKSREKQRRRQAKTVMNSNRDFDSFIKKSPIPKNYYDKDELFNPRS